MYRRMQVIKDLKLCPFTVTTVVLLPGSCDGVHHGLLVRGKLELIIELRLCFVRDVKEDAVEHIVVSKTQIIIVQFNIVVILGDIMSGFQEVQHAAEELDVTSENGRRILCHVRTLHGFGLLHDRFLLVRLLHGTGEDIDGVQPVVLFLGYCLYIGLFFLLGRKDFRNGSCIAEGLVDLDFLVHE